MTRRRRNATSAVKTAAMAVAETMDKRTQNLLVGAIMDLHNGPFSKADMRDQGIPNWPGYQKALDHLEDWEYYVQRGSGEDAGYVRVDARDIKRAIFGPLVTHGGMNL